MARRIGFSVAVVLGLALNAAQESAYAASPSDSGIENASKRKVGRKTGLPIPRFVSLKKSATNWRVGPGRKYAIAWRYERRNLPVEIIQEFEQWRRVRDADGVTGWVWHSLLSSHRTGIVAPWRAHLAPAGQAIKASFLLGRGDASQNARTVAKPQAGLQVTLKECTGAWCRVSAASHEFWLPQDSLYGVYPGEIFDRD